MSIPRTPDGGIDLRAFDVPAGITIYRSGLCYASVCSALPEDAVDAAMRAYPTGVSSTWQRAGEAFATGEPNPCPCNVHPDTHRHYLYAC